MALIIVAFDTLQNYIQTSNESGLSPLSQRRFYMDSVRSFGELEPLQLPSLVGISFSPSTFLVESIYPAFPDVAYVYQIERPVIRTNTSELALRTASVFGFNNLQGGNLDAPIYNWQSADFTKSLRFDFATMSWDLTTDFINNIDARSSKRLLSNIDQYVSPTNSLIRRLGFLTRGLDTPDILLNLAIRNLNGDFIEARSIFEAEYVFVNVRRVLPLADLKPRELQPERQLNEIIPSPVSGIVRKLDPRRGSLNMIVSNSLSDPIRDVFEFDHVNFQYSNLTGAYLIINPVEAFTELQRGRGALVSILPENGDRFSNYSNITIRRIRFDARRTELGYYEPDSWVNNGLVYPIYIFRGTAEMDDGRLATVEFYVDAIKRL